MALALTASTYISSNGPELVGMKRLDLHGDVVASFAPHISTCSSSYDEAQTGRPA